MEQKSYNSIALKGIEYDDKEFQQEMADIGINIPDKLLYTKELNDFVAEEIYKQNVNDFTSEINPYTGQKRGEESAIKEAIELKKQAVNNLHSMADIRDRAEKMIK